MRWFTYRMRPDDKNVELTAAPAAGTIELEITGVKGPAPASAK